MSLRRGAVVMAVTPVMVSMPMVMSLFVFHCVWERGEDYLIVGIISAPFSARIAQLVRASC